MEVYKLYRRLLWVQAEVICISSYQSIIYIQLDFSYSNVSFVTRSSSDYDLPVPILVTVIKFIVLAVFCIALDLLIFTIALNHIFTSSRQDSTIMKIISDIRRHFIRTSSTVVIDVSSLITSLNFFPFIISDATTAGVAMTMSAR